MRALSDNFSRSEFACQCGCGMDTVDAELVAVLEKLRDNLRSQVIITSGNRCEARNALVGGAPDSEHMRSKAVDVEVVGVMPSAVADAAERIMRNYGGVGRYNTHTHIDVRERKARWDNTI